MSFRPGLFPQLFRSRPLFPQAPLKRAFHPHPHASARPRPQDSRVLTLTRSSPKSSSSSLPVYSLGLGLTFLGFQALSRPTTACQSPIATTTPFSSRPTPEIGGGNPPPHSELSGYQLGFGAVCGICTGVFVKKGLKAIAFLLGGVFVLMQYLSSKKFISVDWSKLSGTYDRTFGTKTPTGEVRAPSVGGVWAWFVDFVTANFQQRASFLAGLALGLRLG